MREPVSVTGIERGSRFEAVRSLQYSSNMSRSDRNNLTQRTNGRRNSIVRCAEQPAAVLDGSHTCHIQVLPRSAIPSIPSVVGDVDEQFRSVLREAKHLIRKDRFVTDECPNPVIIHTQWIAFIAARQIADVMGQRLGKT